MKSEIEFFLLTAVFSVFDTVLHLTNICRMSEYARKGAVAIGSEENTP